MRRSLTSVGGLVATTAVIAILWTATPAVASVDAVQFLPSSVPTGKLVQPPGYRGAIAVNVVVRVTCGANQGVTVNVTITQTVGAKTARATGRGMRMCHPSTLLAIPIRAGVKTGPVFPTTGTAGAVAVAKTSTNTLSTGTVTITLVK